MRASRSCAVIAVSLAVPLMAAAAANARTLRIGGTGSALGLLQQVAAEFTNATESKLDVIGSLGSTGAIRALADGKLDLVVSARPLKADEAAAGLRQAMVLRTAYVLATSHLDPNGLTRADLPQIFAAKKTAWADGVPFRLILRPRSEADTALLGKLFPGMDSAIEAARHRAEVPTAATDQDNVALAARMPGSLTGTTMTQLITERPNLRMVRIDGIEPTMANFESGVYPFTKHLYVIHRSNDSAAAQGFIDFLRSPRGTQALHATGTLLGER